MEDAGRTAGGTLGEYAYPSRNPSSPIDATREQRSTADLLKEIVGNVQDIIRAEVRLAKAEVRTETTKGLAAAKLLGAGAVLGLYALGFILLSAVYLLSAALPPWVAALIVGAVVGGVAVMLLLKGRDQLKHVSPKPDKTIENVKENVAWMKDQTKS